jgi:hypothetical protein
MKRAVHESWPPLIVASDKPAWVTWRDFFLTLLMWIVFAIMLETEFELFFGRYLERLGLGDFQTDAHWDVFLERLKPYIVLVVVMLVVLVGTTLATLQRVRRALRTGLAPALAPEEQAPFAHMTPEALVAARQLRIATVYVDPDGSRRVEDTSAAIEGSAVAPGTPPS